MSNETKDMHFAKTALKIGFVTPEDVEAAKEKQRVDEVIGESKHLSDYFLASGKLTAEQISEILNFIKEDSSDFVSQQYKQRLAEAIANFSPVFRELPPVKKTVIPKSGKCTLRSWLWIMVCTFIGSVLGLLLGFLLSEILPLTPLAFYLGALAGTFAGAHFGGHCRNNIKYALALTPTALFSLFLSLVCLNSTAKDTSFAILVYLATPPLLFYYFYTEANFCENCNTGFEDKELFAGDDISPNKVLEFLEKRLFPLEDSSILKADSEFPCRDGQKNLQVVANMCPTCHLAIVYVVVNVSGLSAMVDRASKRFSGKAPNKTLTGIIVGLFGLVCKLLPNQKTIHDSEQVVVYSELWSGAEVDMVFKLRT